MTFHNILIFALAFKVVIQFSELFYSRVQDCSEDTPAGRCAQCQDVVCTEFLMKMETSLETTLPGSTLTTNML